MAADPIVAPPRPRAPQRPRLRPAPPPRRVSGPAPARTGRPRAGAVALPAPNPLQRPLELLRGLPDSRLLDRLIRGQGWVVLIGLALMGIVALQVSLLKMNAGIGASIERGAQLERQNADLRAEVGRLSSEERITTVAGRLGMVMPDANEFRYVRARGEVDAKKAASVMRAPKPVEAGTTASTSATTATPAAAGTTTTSAPASGTTATAPPATTTTQPAQPAPAAPTTPTHATPAAGTAAGATAAPAGTTPAPGH